MGHSSAFRYASAFAAALAVAGCDRQTWSRDEIADIAADAQDGGSEPDAATNARIDDLENQIAELERQIAGVRALGLENAGNTDRLREVVNGNADISNQEKLAEMTRRGACGTEVTRLENGGFMNRQIPCTLDDLK